MLPFGKQSALAILTFDGRVLEVFGFSEVERYHVARLRIDVLEARRDGAVPLRIVGPGRSFTMNVGPDQLDEINRFLEPVRGAMGSSLNAATAHDAGPADQPASSLGERESNVPGGELDEVVELVRSGKNLDAITLYRARTGASFSEAQAYIAKL